MDLQCSRRSRLLLVFVCITIVTAMISVSCSSPLSTVPEDNYSATESQWKPDASKISFYPRTPLQEGVEINIPPGDLRIVPFEIKQGERIKTFGLTVISGGGYQSFFRDSEGNIVFESTMAPWPAGTYYFYIRNDSPTSEYCRVRLTIRFMPE